MRKNTKQASHLHRRNTYLLETPPTPCPKCANSPVRAESCVSIQKTWLKTGQNVSLVVRRLGVSRNTVYKHIEKQDTP